MMNKSLVIEMKSYQLDFKLLVCKLTFSWQPYCIMKFTCFFAGELLVDFNLRINIWLPEMCDLCTGCMRCVKTF